MDNKDFICKLVLLQHWKFEILILWSLYMVVLPANNPVQREVITQASTLICGFVVPYIPSQRHVYMLKKLKHNEGRSCLRPYNRVLIKVGTDTRCLNSLSCIFIHCHILHWKHSLNRSSLMSEEMVSLTLTGINLVSWYVA